MEHHARPVEQLDIDLFGHSCFLQRSCCLDDTWIQFLAWRSGHRAHDPRFSTSTPWCSLAAGVSACMLWPTVSCISNIACMCVVRLLCCAAVALFPPVFIMIAKTNSMRLWSDFVPVPWREVLSHSIVPAARETRSTDKVVVLRECARNSI